ncbi:ABC transporter permease [Oceanibacterium hippocampi]|uniref:Putative aliphatic sulfonates transport permease protein SsuC n=1 Tax=Oceanibacterium hippocampi TaxID=745714 RepID=A0A1Y5T9D2_9PROT|nr:ABC transporter permease [Oceanibacterium hippocampi]SLN55272.1 Putative aliphatic sulfonates transport permease protein SsuC [Oceanibacterium hippocampi]
MSIGDSGKETSVRFRGGGFAPRPKRWASWLAFAVIISAWQIASMSGALPALFLPSPYEIALALQAIAADGTLARHLGASLGRIAWGWSLGTLAGLAVGISMGIWSLARSVGIPIVSALFPIPKIALLPLLILWFGIGEPSKVATILLGVFFPTVISAYSAVDNVPRNLIRMGQSFDMPYAQIVRKIVLPGAMPGILAGFRISSSIALILLVAAEMIGAEFGIGAFILSAGNLMQTDQLLAGVVLLSMLGLLISALLARLERRVLKWR